MSLSWTVTTTRCITTRCSLRDNVHNGLPYWRRASCVTLAGGGLRNEDVIADRAGSQRSVHQWDLARRVRHEVTQRHNTSTRHIRRGCTHRVFVSCTTTSTRPSDGRRRQLSLWSMVAETQRSSHHRRRFTWRYIEYTVQAPSNPQQNDLPIRISPYLGLWCCQSGYPCLANIHPENATHNFLKYLADSSEKQGKLKIFILWWIKIFNFPCFSELSVRYFKKL